MTGRMDTVNCDIVREIWRGGSEVWNATGCDDVYEACLGLSGRMRALGL